MDEHVTSSFAISGEKGLLEEVSRAVSETLRRFDLKVDPGALRPRDTERWEQEGGWYLVVQPDPWSQDGGWVLDLNGRVTNRMSGRPSELVVRDVWAALDRCSARRGDMDPWEQAWGPTPRPKPGPGPDPAPPDAKDPRSIRRPRS